MKLQEVFDQLSAGEFSQLSIGGEEQGVLNAFNIGKILGHVNLGLTSLFTRFNLKEGRLEIPLVADQVLYALNEPSILKVERVMTAEEYELPLNDKAKPYSVLTPSLFQLRVPEVLVTDSACKPEGLDTDGLIVVYRANHPNLVFSEVFTTADQIELELPYSHFSALLYFVASRVHNPIGMSNEFHAGNSYYAKYEAVCQELEGKGLQVDQGETNTKLVRNGWA